MILYNNYLTFTIKGQEVNIISEELDNGIINTVSEIDSTYHYLGEEYPNILSAILAWETHFNDALNVDDLHQVMIENNLVSDAI